MPKRKPPTRGRPSKSGRSGDFPQNQRGKGRFQSSEKGSPADGAASRRGKGQGGGPTRGPERPSPHRERGQFRDQPRDAGRPRAPGHSQAQSQPGGPYWLYGNHAVTAALGNPERKLLRLARTGADIEPGEVEGGSGDWPEWEQVPRDILESWLPFGAVHQSIAAKVHPLPERGIEDVVADAADRDQAVVLILDQVTDPQNVGAILRSAAAFGAIAVVLTERHAAPESGALGKAASGALEHVPLVRVANLARALETLKKGGFWIAGLAAEAERTLAQAKLTGKIGLALGAEGPGLRRLTREHCDLLVRLPTGGPIDHLNVSNAAAVSLYELVRESVADGSED